MKPSPCVKKLKVQGVPQSQATANPWHQEEENKDRKWHMQDKQTNAREAYRQALSSSSEMITMLTRTEKKHTHKNKPSLDEAKNNLLTSVEFVDHQMGVIWRR